MRSLLLAVLLLGAVSASAMDSGEAFVSRDGRFSMRLPFGWKEIEQPRRPGDRLAGRWELRGRRSSVLITAVDLGGFARSERKRPAYSMCRRGELRASREPRGERWTACAEHPLPNLVELYYRTSAKSVLAAFQLPNGLVYGLWANGHQDALPSLKDLDGVLATIRPRGRDPRRDKPKCSPGYAAILVDSIDAVWECRETGRRPFRLVIKSAGGGLQPIIEVDGCRQGQRVVRTDWPRQGDHSCVDFSDGSARLVEAGGGAAKDCPADRIPVLLNRRPTKLPDYLCPEAKPGAPAGDASMPQLLR